LFFFFSSRRRHTRFSRDWSSDVCSSDLLETGEIDDMADAITEYIAERVLERERAVEGDWLSKHIRGHAAAEHAARVKAEAEATRSEERRVGKECRARGAADRCEKKSG